MMSWRTNTENFFESWSEVVVAHRWVVLLTVLGLTFALWPSFRHSQADFSTESYLPRNEQSVIDYNNFRLQFGQSSTAVVTIETPSDVFELSTLQRLRELQQDIEAQVPNIYKVTSLISARHSSGEQDTLVIRDLIELWPTHERELPAFKRMVMANPNYVGSIVSENQRLTSIIIQLNNYTSVVEQTQAAYDPAHDEALLGFDDELMDADAVSDTQPTVDNFLRAEEETEFAQRLIEVAEAYSTEGFKVHVSGTPVVNYKLADELGTSTMRDMGLGILVLILLLGVLFQRISGVLLPLLAVILSLVSTLALMPAFGIPFTGTTQILPTFILAVGIADAIHILSIFYRRFDETGDKHASIVFTMRQTSIAILVTTATTAAGLLSFAFADLKPTQYLGIFGAAGVVLALIYTAALLPALLAILPIKRKQPNTVTRFNQFLTGVLHRVDGCITGMGVFAVRHAKAVFGATLLLSALAIAGVTQVFFSHDPMRWYPEGHPTRVTNELVSDEMSGSQSLELVVDSGVENGLYNPDVLNLLDRMQGRIENWEANYVYAKQAVSILSVVKENHKALHAGDEAYYRVPDERATIAQELFLFENSGSDDLQEFTDSGFQLARVSITYPWQNVIYLQGYLDALEAEMQQLIQESGLREEGYSLSLTKTGIMAIFAKTIRIMLEATIESYLLAFSFVGGLMFLLMGSWRKGLLAFVPNVLPVLFTLGIMGWLGIPLNILTSMLGCIIIGISVDDTIHFMHHFRRFVSSNGGDAELAVSQSLQMVGRAITFTSIVLIGCFMMHLTDTFVNAKEFGGLLSISIALALFANLLVAPALMTLFWNAASRRETSVETPAEVVS